MKDDSGPSRVAGTAEMKSAMRRGSTQHREARSVSVTLACLNPGNGLECAVRRDHQRFRFGVPLLGREGGAEEALRLRDAPVARRIELLSGAQCGSKRGFGRSSVAASDVNAREIYGDGHHASVVSSKLRFCDAQRFFKQSLRVREPSSLDAKRVQARYGTPAWPQPR